LNTSSIDHFVYPANPLSVKTLDLQSKFNALEDAMQVIKKAYDKDEITLDEYLKFVRQLSQRQARKQVKINKLTNQQCPDMTGQMGQHF
jgi:hypothetical protein